MNIDKILEDQGLKLPNPPAKGGIYDPVVKFGGNLYYLSGCGPVINGEQMMTGRLGSEYNIEEGQLAAKYCMLNLLANLKREIGDLSKVKKIVKMLCFVSSDNNFFDQPMVANGASQLLVDVFGEDIGSCSRSAIGVNSLPTNIPVEIELIVEV